MTDKSPNEMSTSFQPSGVESLSRVAESPGIEMAIEAVRELVGFDVAYATELTEDEQRFRALNGDGESFGVSENTVLDIEDTYCVRVLRGDLPELIPNIDCEPEAAGMPFSEEFDIGAFLSIPLRFSDGRTFGTLCAASHSKRPDIGEKELQFLRVFARIISDQFEREALQEISRAMEVKLTAALALVAAVDARDCYTAEHSHHVVDLAADVAFRLGLPEDVVNEVRLVAALHDIGKIATPDSILRKEDPLTEEEWRVMKEHPVEGEKLVSQSPGLKHLAPMIRAEHERWDGGGYPDGLKGEAIPVASRITLACDAYSAMVTDRPYRKAISAEEAKAEIRACSGTHFDPKVAGALLEILG